MFRKNKKIPGEDKKCPTLFRTHEELTCFKVMILSCLQKKSQENEEVEKHCCVQQFTIFTENI